MKRDVEVWLKALVKYVAKSLDAKHARMLRKVRMVNSNRAEQNNQKSARSFCYVNLDGETIYYSEALTYLDLEFIIGILLHELAHLVVKAGPVDDEADADSWILEAFPETRYDYDDTVYTSPWTGRMRTAKNLQCVSREFVRRLV